MYFFIYLDAVWCKSSSSWRTHKGTSVQDVPQHYIIGGAPPISFSAWKQEIQVEEWEPLILVTEGVQTQELATRDPTKRWKELSGGLDLYSYKKMKYTFLG